MTSQYRHRRTSNPATAFPNPIEPGEIAVNTANRQLVVGDAASGVAGVPLPLLALRFYDTRAIYAAGDMVYQANVVYRAKVACGPESFNPAHWDSIAGVIDPRYVQKIGDVMTGSLSLPSADPTLPVHATHKAYVDAGLATKANVIAAVSAPDITTVPDNSLWYETDLGTFYIAYNDGDSRQWVIASPQPDPGTFVFKAGDTMQGYLVLNADPVTPLGAATGQYAVAVAAAAANTRVAKTGDVMTGALEHATVPTLNQHVANKLYVDGKVDAKSSTIVSDTPPPGAPDGTIWIESDTGLAFVRYNDGNSSQWIALLSTAATAVLYSAQTLTAAQQLQARINISVPIVKKNYLINGAMQVSQEYGSTAAVNVSGAYVVDCWMYLFGTATGTSNCVQAASPTPAGSPNRFRTVVTATDANAVATNYVAVRQCIEGLRVADLRQGSAVAKTITIQFGVKAPAGTYCISLQNTGVTRSYIAEYVIAAGEANVDVVKSVTIALDTTGTWATDNTAGLYVLFCLMAGTTYQTPAGVWTAANKFCSPNQFNFMSTNGNIFELFDVSLTEGTVAPPFQVLDYASELIACQRYYFIETSNTILYAEGVSLGSGTNPITTSFRFPVVMRAAPTITTTYQVGGTTAPVASPITTGGFAVVANSSSALNQRLYFLNNSPIKISARL